MNLPVRKNIRLKNHDYSHNGVYFCTICAKEKYCLFGDIVGGDAHIAPQIHLTQCGQIVEKYMDSIPGIDRYVIMPNHLHMIIVIGRGPMRASAPTKRQALPSIVRSFKTMVTKEYGVSVWQRNYYEHIIRDKREYFAVCQYIEKNPVNWANDEYNDRRDA